MGPGEEGGQGGGSGCGLEEVSDFMHLAVSLTLTAVKCRDSGKVTRYGRPWAMSEGVARVRGAKA